MNIEILGAGTNNKGAHLMRIAAVDQVRQFFPEARLAVRSKKEEKTWDTGSLGLYQKPALSESLAGKLVTMVKFGGKARQQYHMILDSEIDAVLDASGFKYSDQFGKLGVYRRAKRIARWKRSGKKIILLPQAFGPFEVDKVREAIKIIVNNSDLVFPRDRDSYDYITQVVGEQEHVKIYPDFTNIVDGVVPAYFSAAKPRACLVPNTQMLAKTSGSVAESYIPFFTKCARFLFETGFEPFILIHDLPRDKPLADKIKISSNIPLEIIEDENPLHLKGIIGECRLLIGSRFHALISALSQAIPAIATSWSHKYVNLYNDYGCPDLLISNLDFEAEASEKLRMLLTDNYYQKIVNTLEKSAEVEAQKTKQMWQDVRKVLYDGSRS